jgi:adhesin/invasin
VILSTVLSLSLLAGTSQAAGAPSVVVTVSPTSITADGKSKSMATAIVKDAAGNAVPGDPVTFASSDPGETFDSKTATTNAQGVATATITSSTTAGAATITATSASLKLSGTTTLTQTAGPPANVVVTVSPSTIAADGTSTSTATATVTDANKNPVTGGMVTFASSDPGEMIDPKQPVTTNAQGLATATITSSTTPGTAMIKASAGSVAGFAFLTQASSTTSLLTLPSAPATNQGVTVIATVTSSTSAASPSGTITFQNGGIPISGCVNDPVAGSGQSVNVTCQTSFSASTSPEQLTAVFSAADGSSVAGSTSPPVSLPVGPDSTSTSLDVSNPTVKVGAKAQYTATVTPSHAGPVKPSGSVAFLDGGKPIASCATQPLGASSAATCTVTYTAAGGHTITARYGGDGSFSGSASSPPQQVTVRTSPPPIVTATMHWSFFYTPTYTKVLALVANQAPVNGTVVVMCRGGGCPFAKRTTTIKPCRRPSKHGCPSPRIDLTSRFRGHLLRAGARVTVRFIRTAWVGKQYQFSVRGGHAPRIQIACLAPQGTRPGVGC